jgi:branched-chain amino acid transport system substrate-binding protein
MLKLLSDTSKEDGKDYTDGLVNSQVVPSYENLNMPAVREYRDLMDKYNPMPPADLIEADYKPLQYSFVSLEGFLNAKMLVDILQQMGAQPRRVQIAPTVESIHDFDLGMGKPVSFGIQRNQGSDAVYYTGVHDGRFVPIRDWKEWFK